MNIIKQLIITPKIRKEVHHEMNNMIKQSGVKDYDLKTVQDMERGMVRCKIELIKMSEYPLYQRGLDRLNEIIDCWIDYHKSKSAYYKEQKVWGYRY